MACDGKFKLATVFKTAEEQALLMKQAIDLPIAHPPEEVEV